MSTIKHFFDDITNSISNWFHSRSNHERYIDSHRFLMNLLYLAISFIAALIIYDNIVFFNQYTLIFIRLGSSLLLVSVYFICRFIYYIIKQLRDHHHNLSNGYKALFAVVIILFLLLLYINSDVMTEKIKNTTDKIVFSNLNPFVTSELIGKSNVVSEKQSNTNNNINPLQNILPSPWNYLVFWGIIITIVLVLLNKYVFHDDFPSWLTWILVILAIIMVFQYKFPYDTVPVRDMASCDANGNVHLENNFMGLGEFSLAASCMDYKSSQCRPKCVNNAPVCQCEANLVDLVFHQKGDWILGGFGI